MLVKESSVHSLTSLMIIRWNKRRPSQLLSSGPLTWTPEYISVQLMQVSSLLIMMVSCACAYELQPSNICVLIAWSIETSGPHTLITAVLC